MPVMQTLGHHDIVVAFLSLGTLLAVASAFGELARKIGQPTVLGELAAGIILGPTCLGYFAPNLTAALFPAEGPVRLVIEGCNMIAVVLFLLVSGMEINLSRIWQQGKSAVCVSIGGLVLPFGIGLITATVIPDWTGRHEGADAMIYSLFFATALSISALPVIARTLMDLNLYRSDLGIVVISAAICDDVAGWIVFAAILGLAGAKAGTGFAIGTTILLTITYAVSILTLGRWLFHRLLPWIQAHTTWPKGILAFALSLSFIGAAYTEWIGVHAIFGSFLVGVAIGDSSHLREHTRTVINQFVTSIFAPLFFAGIGLRINFFSHFDVQLVLIILVIASVGKLVGCGYGARLGGIAPREALAVGFAMNARGGMGIILGLLALQYGIIRESVFVALVIMAIFTSMISGPAMQKILRLRRPRGIREFIKPASFVKTLQSVDRYSTIRELSAAVSPACGIVPELIERAVLARERLGSTGIGDGLSVPHARLAGLASPQVAVGLSRNGVDFDAPDGLPAHLIFLILTPLQDNGAQIDILADIARTFRSEEVRSKAVLVANHTEFLALLRTGAA